jgi:hypothetical protein
MRKKWITSSHLFDDPSIADNKYDYEFEVERPIDEFIEFKHSSPLILLLLNNIASTI